MALYPLVFQVKPTINVRSRFPCSPGAASPRIWSPGTHPPKGTPPLNPARSALGAAETRLRRLARRVALPTKMTSRFPGSQASNDRARIRGSRATGPAADLAPQHHFLFHRRHFRRISHVKLGLAACRRPPPLESGQKPVAGPRGRPRQLFREVMAAQKAVPIPCRWSPSPFAPTSASCRADHHQARDRILARRQASSLARIASNLTRGARYTFTGSANRQEPQRGEALEERVHRAGFQLAEGRGQPFPATDVVVHAG